MTSRSVMATRFLINFIFKHIFLLIICTSYFSSGYTNQQQHHLGCQAVIPCQQDRGVGRTLKWFYKEQEGNASILIFLQEPNGMTRFGQHFHSKMKVDRSWSLVIDSVKEEYKGLYWCEVCSQQGCPMDQPTRLSITTDTIKEIQKTLFLQAGTTFTHDCSNNSTDVKWTFEASKATPKSSAQQPQGKLVTSNTTLQIYNVSTENVGKFTCWTLGCTGLWQKLLTINMCVITVHCSEDSSVSCAVVCDVESSKIKPKQTSNKESDRRTMSAAALNESLMCGETVISVNINCSTGPGDKLNNLTGTQHDLTAIILGVLAVLLFLIVILLFAYYLEPGLQRVIPEQCCCCGLNGSVEDEVPVVYSSIIIRRPADKGNNISCVSDNNCMYAEINVQK